MADDRVARKTHELLTIQYPGAVQKVADYLGETYNHVMQNINGRVKSGPHVSIIRASFAVTGDPFFKRELEADGWELHPKRIAEATRDAESEATDIVLSASKLINTIRESVADNRITATEADELERCFCDLEKELVEARCAVRKLSQAKRFKAVK